MAARIPAQGTRHRPVICRARAAEKIPIKGARQLVHALLLAGGILFVVAALLPAVAESNTHAGTPIAATARKSSPYTPDVPDSAREVYAIDFGVDLLSVKLAESGALVRFSYRVTDADKALPLHDRASSPQLLDEKAGVMLQVPTLEKVGPLRQSVEPEAGKSYWMVFSNKGNFVRAGNRVSVLIGGVRLDGLIVQ
jgi:hypothetical protein